MPPLELKENQCFKNHLGCTLLEQLHDSFLFAFGFLHNVRHHKPGWVFYRTDRTIVWSFLTISRIDGRVNKDSP